MKNVSPVVRLGLLAALLAASSAVAQTVTLGWNFSDDNAIVDTGTPINFSLTALSIGNTFGTVTDSVTSVSVSSGYTGASGTFNIGNAVALGAFNAATSAYYELTFTPSAGFAIQLVDFDFGTRSTATGPQVYTLATSADAFGSAVTTGAIANNSVWSFKDNTFVSVTGSVDTALTVRLYTSGGAGSPASGTINSRLDDLSIQVAAVAIPEPSTYAALLGAATLGLVVWRRRARR